MNPAQLADAVHREGGRIRHEVCGGRIKSRNLVSAGSVLGIRFPEHSCFPLRHEVLDIKKWSKKFLIHDEE